jgi:hypothetical protein
MLPPSLPLYTYLISRFFRQALVKNQQGGGIFQVPKKMMEFHNGFPSGGGNFLPTHNLRLTEFCNRKLPGFGLVFG